MALNSLIVLSDMLGAIKKLHTHPAIFRVTTLQTMWQFPDDSRHSSVALAMLTVTHIMSVLGLLSVVGVGMQQYMIRNHTFNI